jgi:hypothetical protein
VTTGVDNKVLGTADEGGQLPYFVREDVGGIGELGEEVDSLLARLGALAVDLRAEVVLYVLGKLAELLRPYIEHVLLVSHFSRLNMRHCYIF